MKGLILAGGTGSRLRPLTLAVNKHLLPIYKRPMIYYPLYTLTSAGITDILVITSPGHMGGIMELLGSGKEFDCDISYRVQDTAGGLPHAIAVGEKFVGNDKFLSVNGDNIFAESLKPAAQAFEHGNEEERVVLAKAESLEQASKSGVAQFEGEKIIGFVEKPKDPPSEWIATGAYFFTPNVFHIIRSLKPSARGELEITDLHNHYLSKKTLGSTKLSTPWADAGSFDEWLEANNFAKKHDQDQFLGKIPFNHFK